MAFGKSNEKQAEALQGFDSAALERIRDQARAAQLARRKTFVARLPLPAEVDAGYADVPSWSAALQQVGQFGFELDQWSVCPEANGPVAYAVFAAQ